MNRRLMVWLFVMMTLPWTSGCHKNKAGEKDTAAVVSVKASTETIIPQKVQATEEAAGVVRSKAAATIQSKLMGHILSVHVTEGTAVTVGMPLIDIDDREVAAQAQKAKSALSEAQSALQEVEKGFGAAQAAKNAAIANQNLANSTLRRLDGLAKDQAISRQTYDEANAKQKAAAAEANQADEMLKSFEAKKSEASARIEQAQAELANAQVMLGYARIVSPVDGVVTRKSAEVGDLAAPNMPLLEIEDNRQYRLEANVDESRVGLFHAGDTVSVTVDALGPNPISGTVAEVVPASDPGSHTFLVKVDLPAAPNLHSGLFGRLRYVSSERNALCVPRTAIVDRGQLTSVFVVGNDRIARLRLITTGKPYGERIEVLSGLSEGEIVVANDLAQVQDGIRVE